MWQVTRLCSCVRRFLPIQMSHISWFSGHWLTCAVDVLETLLVWIHESFLYVYVSVAVMLLVSVLAVAPVPVHVSGLTTGAPSPAFASISSRHRDANVDGLVVWGQIRTVSGWLHECALHSTNGCTQSKLQNGNSNFVSCRTPWKFTLRTSFNKTPTFVI